MNNNSRFQEYREYIEKYLSNYYCQFDYGLQKCEELVEKYTNAAIDHLEQFENAEELIALSRSMTVRRA